MVRFNLRRARPHLVLLLFIGLMSVPFVRAQDQELRTDPAEKAKSELVDEFGRVGECDFGGRMDAFMAALSEKPDHQGYIINYLGADTLPADREKYLRERMMINHLTFRNFDRSRLTIVRGGFRESIMTELWIVPPEAELPSPSRTVPEPKIPANTTFLFDKGYFLTEYGNPIEEFVLESVKAREEAERLKQEAEWEAEQTALGENVESAQVEQTNEPEPPAEDASNSDEAEAVEEDERTPEEIEADRFSWAEGPVWLYLSQHPKDSGVMIFYADDQYYDIQRLQSFVIEGRNRMANLAGIKPSRVRIVFGGYRESTEFEFWIVPPKGKRPVAVPEERPVEEAETDGN